MAKPTAKSKLKLKNAKKAISNKDKISKKKGTTLTAKSSKVQKKKKRTIKEVEEVIEKKTNKSKSRAVVVDEDDIDSEEEDLRPAKKVSHVIDDLDEDPEGDDSVDPDDIDDSDDTSDEHEESNDLASVDPGPEISEVPCGFYCGSCTKFVKLDNPIRNDAEWLTSQYEKKTKRRCPFLFPEDVELNGRPITEFVVRADSKACDQFDFNDTLASEALLTVLGDVRSKLDGDEMNVLAFTLDKTRTLKASEASYGYSLGEKCRVCPDGFENSVLCEVVDFQRKKNQEVIVRPLAKVKGMAARYAIPARKAVAM